MTAQTPEILIYHGEEITLHSIPEIPSNHPLIRHNENQPEFLSTGCWRGYIGTWELKNRKLYLKSINGKYSIRMPIFADWYSGVLTIPESEPGDYFHGGWGRMYAKNQLITIVNGEITTIHYQNKNALGYIDSDVKKTLNKVIGTIIDSSNGCYLKSDEQQHSQNEQLIFTFDSKVILEAMAGKIFINLQSYKLTFPIATCLAKPNTVDGHKLHLLVITIPELWAMELKQIFIISHYRNNEIKTEYLNGNWHFSAKEEPKANLSSMLYNEPPMDFDDDIPF
ncbi:hypothetical protein C0W88_07660 [Photobacterium leiognathi subsp. mandapamensis]|uniref:hypothetical protein n=1 Tax=Photobacterium leiognathi TaxID=553611 RepID=UPI000D17682B|nr:hypothetical protein [Photobacterium leiognathi]PSW66250.1 hypothetical protein C0W88_07660 [Photobacterium leiognathi subsp. mandapamensis]